MSVAAATTVCATIASVTGIMAQMRSNNAALNPMLPSRPVVTTESLKKRKIAMKTRSAKRRPPRTQSSMMLDSSFVAVRWEA
ncbi:hypothetical protein ABMA32_04725 [Mesorhizobium sp. VNQ89]|uniref:hypothetical protein n=1 Tax=Mesorhizobium quangtriensis TaxID=3157709 RepID=UPI0032B755EA